MDANDSRIDAAALKIVRLDAKIVTTPKRKVIFTMNKDRSASYAQFVICTVTKPIRCNPSEKVPGISTADEYEFLSPPAGELEIKARACIEDQYTLNPETRCGKWKRASIRSQALM